MEIGQIIKKRRIELGMSQDELAHKVGYKSRSSINKIEIDGRGLPQNKIVAFAKALNTTPAYLMGWEEELLNHVVEEDKDIVSNVLKNALPYEEVNEKYSSLKSMLNSFGYDLIRVNGEYSLIGDGASVITKEEVEELYQSTVNFLEFNAKKLLKEKLYK
jgi:transcriptional regulator with XRE-family HTH domain